MLNANVVTAQTAIAFEFIPLSPSFPQVQHPRYRTLWSGKQKNRHFAGFEGSGE
jgi:hypothetical protein